MTIQMNDRATISQVRRLSDGRVAAVARFARSGVYEYAGSELGRPDLARVKVYRDESEVFSEDSMASFAHKTITLGHPNDSVTAGNWKKVAVGYTEGRVARDGGFVQIPLMVADAAAVAAIDNGTAKELSAGYSCDLVWGDGIAPNGEAYQAKQVGIRGDHIALVPAGRAGSECRVGDAAPGNFLNDAERQFADSPEGKMHIALAKNNFDVGQAYRHPDERRAWTPQMADAAVRSTLQARAGFQATAASQTADAKRLHDAEMQARKQDLNNAWRNGAR